MNKHTQRCGVTRNPGFGDCTCKTRLCTVCREITWQEDGICLRCKREGHR